MVIQIAGPLSSIEIEHKIRTNDLPANVLVCEEGHEVWTEFYSWKRAKMSVMQLMTIEEIGTQLKTAATAGLRQGLWIVLWIVVGVITLIAVLAALGIRPAW